MFQKICRLSKFQTLKYNWLVEILYYNPVFIYTQFSAFLKNLIDQFVIFIFKVV
jgi:hypothetical protein